MSTVRHHLLHNITFEVDSELSLEDLHEMLCILVHEGRFWHQDSKRMFRINRWREHVMDIQSDDLNAVEYEDELLGLNETKED